MLWSQTDLVEATAGDLLGEWGNDGVAGVSIDSRSIKMDELFVAIKAARDGHSFINDAINLGAKAAMVCLLYTSPSPRDRQKSRMPSSA